MHDVNYANFKNRFVYICKWSGVTTLFSYISAVCFKSLDPSRPCSRTKKELDRKGGGAGEGVQWFSASTMKTKLAQMVRS